MTVTSLPVRDEFTGTAAQTVFNYTFLIFEDTDLSVYITPVGQEASDSADITTAYTVDPGTIGNPVGGFITLNSGVTAGDLVTIVSDIPENRTIDYQNSGDFRPDTVNDDFDRVVSLVKQADETASRTLQFSQSQQNVSAVTMDPPSAGLYLAWNATEDGVENVGAPSIAIPSELGGTLLELIADTSRVVGELIMTTGYHVAGDGGDNTYEIVAAATGTDDGGSFIDLVTFQAKGLFPGGVVNLNQFGALGDGDSGNQTLNHTALTNAMAFSNRVLVPEGDFQVEFAGNPNFTPPVGSILEAASRDLSELTMILADTTTRNLFQLSNDNITFKNLKITIDGPVLAAAQMFSMRANGLRFIDCEFSAGNTAGNLNEVNCFTYLDDNTDDILTRNCLIHNFNRINLRANTRTGVITNVSFIGGTFSECEVGGANFNCPGTQATGILYDGVTFNNFHTTTFENIWAGGASLKGVQIVNCRFEGDAVDCIHLEEAGEDIVISNNVCIADAKFLAVIYNDIGLTAIPARIIVSNNACEDGSLVRDNVCLNFPVNKSNNAYDSLVISGNVMKGYGETVILGPVPADVNNNYIVNCDVGIKCEIPRTTYRDNTFDNVSTGFTLTGVGKGGLVGRNFFRWSDGFKQVADSSAGDGSGISMTGFELTIESDVNIPVGLSNIDVGIERGEVMYGQSKVNISMDGTSFHHRISLIDWDGTTFTDTEEVRFGAGLITFTGFTNNSGELAIRLNNTDAGVRTLEQMTLQFDGIWVSTN